MTVKPQPDGEGAAENPEAEFTGLPWLNTWRRVYLWVLGVFAAYVVLLTVLSRAYR
jgi:hypothetical protein